MDQETARRRSTAIGAGSVLIGGILSAWPGRLVSAADASAAAGLGDRAARPPEAEAA
jgi:hypothetical protein